MSNDDELSPEDLACAYRKILGLEECWRSMKLKK